MGLSFPTLQRRNALRDAPRRKRGRRASHDGGHSWDYRSLRSSV
ncbi:DUF1534 domain-containing protein, partial [Pseudomonas syringae]|nr:DUF1534 domain-containing protein [Pseudomonas syringae]